MLSLSAPAFLWPGSSDHIVPNPSEPHVTGRITPWASRQPRAKNHGFDLGDSDHIPSQSSRASLKEQAETRRQTKWLSCRWPSCYPVFLLSISSSPMKSVGIDLDTVHGTPKHCVYPICLRSQCLGGTNENKIQPADVGSKRHDRNVIMAVSVWRVKALAKMIWLISQPLCRHS